MKEPLITSPDVNFNSFEKLFLTLPGVVSWKNKNSEYIGGNKDAIKLFGFKNDIHLIGNKDSELKCDASDNVEEFVKQDTIVLQEKKSYNIIDVNVFSDGNISIFNTKKMPILDAKDDPVGVLVQCQKLTDPMMINLILKVCKVDKKFNNQKLGSYLMEHMHFDTGLSARELEVIFYILRGKSSTQIAEILCRSKRTIESHIEHIKFKLNCNNRTDLIDICTQLGLYSYIPKGYFEKSMTIPLFVDN